MKRWKILIAIAIVGILAMPMLPVKAAVSPQYHGDIVFAECKGRDDFPSWDHTAIWDNNDKEIIEADPHFENWEDEEADWTDGTLGYLYPNNDPEDLINKKLTDYSYSGHGGHPGSWYGRVEADSITDIFNNYSAWAYGKVKDVWQWQRNRAVSFANDKVGRPFDFVSPWYTW